MRRNYLCWRVHSLCSMIRTSWSRTVIATLSVGLGPDDVGIDQAADKIVGAAVGDNNISVISNPLHGCSLALILTYESAIIELTGKVAAVGTLAGNRRCVGASAKASRSLWYLT